MELRLPTSAVGANVLCIGMQLPMVPSAALSAFGTRLPTTLPASTHPLLPAVTPPPPPTPPPTSLQGGKEASHSNACLHRIITTTLGPELGPDLISLVTSREEIDSLLALDDVIDLVIPRCVGVWVCVCGAAGMWVGAGRCQATGWSVGLWQGPAAHAHVYVPHRLLPTQSRKLLALERSRGC